MQQIIGSASSLKTGLSGEVISESSLSYGQFLTLDDPREIATPSVFDDATLNKIIMQSAAAPTMDDRAATSSDEKCTKILEYLNSRALQFNSRSKFRSHEPWRQAISNRIHSDQEIQIIIPIFCSIGNPMKRFSETTVTAGEKVTLNFLSNVAYEISKVHTAGCRFNVVVDANFYSTPFMNSVVETNAYFKQLGSYVADNNLSQYISIIDMMEVLSNDSAEFTNRFHDWMVRIGEKESDLAVHPGWQKSMISSLNLRYLARDYKEIRACYSDRQSELRAEVLKMAKKSLLIYRSLKNAAADVFWEDLIGPDCIRSTIHTKQIPVLGLRIYPEYKKKSRLLPYHGIALFGKRSKDSLFRMEILPEMEAVRIPGVVRFLNDKNITQAYALDCEELMRGLAV